MRSVLALALCALAPASDVAGKTTYWLGGSVLGTRAALLELRTTAGRDALGADVHLWGVYDGTFVRPLLGWHGSVSVIASSVSEVYTLSGLVGLGFTAARSGQALHASLAPEVGGRFLWDVTDVWRAHLEGGLSMYEDGYAFLGGLTLQRPIGPNVRAFAGWRLYWITAEFVQAVARHGIVLGITL